MLILSGWVHQIVRGYRTKSLQDMSMYLMVLILAGAALWVVYGAIVADPYVIGTNTAAMALMAVVISMKRRYDEIAKARDEHRVDEMLAHVKNKPPDVRNVTLDEILNRALSAANVPATVSLVRPHHRVDLRCDPDKIRMVFVNLISNSSYAMGGEGTVTVSADRDDYATVIRVSDEGPGIPKEIIDRAFGTAFTTKSTGTGLGLPYCKFVVEQHGGTISVKSHPTMFTITLPDEPPDPDGRR